MVHSFTSCVPVSLQLFPQINPVTSPTVGDFAQPYQQKVLASIQKNLYNHIKSLTWWELHLESRVQLQAVKNMACWTQRNPVLDDIVAQVEFHQTTPWFPPVSNAVHMGFTWGSRWVHVGFYVGVWKEANTVMLAPDQQHGTLLWQKVSSLFSSMLFGGGPLLWQILIYFIILK